MTHRVQFESGESFAFCDDEDTLLRAALRAGLGFPNDCGVGGCGNCRFELVSGDMETLWPEAPGLSERERRRGRRLACQSRPASACVVKVRLSDEYRPAVPGLRLAARLTDRREIAPGMGEFTFHTEAPARFLAGQFAILHPPGVDGARAYSMSNLPNEAGEWRFVIRRAPGGRGSNAMFDRLAIGDAVTIDAPYGRAHWRGDPVRDVVCVAGGSGIGPIAAIVQAALRDGGERRIHVFEGARTEADLCFRKLVPGESPALVYAPALSAEAEGSAWAGARGFIHAHVEAHAFPVERCEFYFAGPPPMIEAMNDLLVMRWRAPLAQVHTDKFF
ncbi:toluene monooxygenase electron transfer component [Roseiarcus fermentans]|uniref:Toluene monooxygenase electron transfer component n=1 Tax=Roseiarcus fermentans TaxID=1473586 RepID=A0A366FBC7_9HYPH|nr:2Fe-2S iron-sulfur cluster binding domain-containing protein [Roseiarcus fermentans]RBP11948.1 toluene monooxygenase electron transfer component [Roseiarcus fermentans]